MILLSRNVKFAVKKKHEFETLDCYKTLKKLKVSLKAKGFSDPLTWINLEEEKPVGTMNTRNEEKWREQKIRQDDIVC